MRLILMIVLLLALTPATELRAVSDDPQFITLEARWKANHVDNYVRAAFSFEFGTNGENALAQTRNDWDILFGNDVCSDTFGVTMVEGDCSRIVDLGVRGWTDAEALPELMAHAEPTVEPSVKAIVGHIYLVHTKDSDSDLYAVFRVENLTPLISVTITWKRLDVLTAPN